MLLSSDFVNFLRPTESPPNHWKKLVGEFVELSQTRPQNQLDASTHVYIHPIPHLQALEPVMYNVGTTLP